MTVPGPFTMSQQAQDDHYGAPDKVGMAYAAAVREEILDLLATGIDVVQVDEPYMQARPDAAREYGLDVLKAATDGIDGTIAVHICFGYAAIIHDRPSGYSFLPELAATECAQVSIETAQSGLELDVLKSLPDKTIILGVLDLSTNDVETPETVAGRITRAFPHADGGRLVAAPDCGMKYLSREVAFGKLKAMVEAASIVRKELS
jgi:5-methyltetrahydropteroyltriglutamate--homocysteine methyltransferase